MPIEIKELHIKATVNENLDSSATTDNSGLGTQSNDHLIQLCVEKVLEIIKEKQER